MTDLLAARAQMAISLGFHILFAVAGMAMPLLMVISEAVYLRTSDEIYLDLTRRWAKGTAILFAVGAVSGTVLSFELGLLWPEFMRYAGPLIGMPFSLEGFAFFLEAIFLGIYLYGWDRISPKAHLLAGVIVALSGLASAVFVVAVNSWMNAPVLFDSAHRPESSPWLAFQSPAFPTQSAHMALSAYVSIAFAVFGIHCAALLRSPKSAFHLAATKIAFCVLVVALPLQLVSGDLSAKHLAHHQPVKLAAAEGLFRTQKGAPLAIFGYPDTAAKTLRGAIHVPRALSFLAKGDSAAEVTGLDAISSTDWPPLAPTHLAFQAMVGLGATMAMVCFMGVLLWFRHRDWTRHRLFLRVAAWTSPAGLLAVEAGWTVTEVGRQPWVIYGVMRTKDAVTPMRHLEVPMIVFTSLYVLLGVIVIVLLKAFVANAPSAPKTSATVA